MWRTFGASMAVVLTVLGCARGPDASALRGEIQRKLDQRFKPGLFALVGLKRQGSAPLPGSESGAKRIAVYFNATLKLAQGYDFGDWEGLSAGTLANVLGATESGIFGMKAGESRAGDVITLYGSSIYEWGGGHWQGVEVTPTGVAKTTAPGNAAPSSRSKQLVDRLAALVNTPPGPGPQAEIVISDELDRALRSITGRLGRRQHVYVFGSGPEEGEYHAVVESLLARVTRHGTAMKTSNAETQGSVENARLIGSKDIDYALIQSNVAAMASAGEGPFAPSGAITSLRALGSLFPEPVHIVVSAASGIRTVADLRGKHVAIGTPQSGTRADALAILAAHGLMERDFVARDEGLESAAGELRAGRLDALFATIGAPSRELQRLATSHPIRLLTLDGDAVDRVLTAHSGLLRLVVPANTYLDQKEPVTTIAATALLVTHADVPDADAEAVLRLVFENRHDIAAASAHAAKISKRTGLRGVTIPLHPAASRYFASGPTTGGEEGGRRPR